MEDDKSLIVKKETVVIEGGRNLYNYTFTEADDQAVEGDLEQP
jgi:hypothetical protein